MHKKIESELVSIAHSILRIKDKKDVVILKGMAKELYEKLSILDFVNRYLETNPRSLETKEDILSKIENAKEIVVEEPIHDPTTEPAWNKNDSKKEPTAEKKSESTEKAKKVAKSTLEEEFRDTIPIDVTTNIFEKSVRTKTPKKSLNDTLTFNNIQIGLNDRIAFVKHLFNGNQENFNKVISKLNSLKTEKEAKRLILKEVKPDYNWSGKEEYEERFITLITRKFS